QTLVGAGPSGVRFGWKPMTAGCESVPSPSQGLKLTPLPATAPVPPGFDALLGPLTLPHQLLRELTVPPEQIGPFWLPSKLLSITNIERGVGASMQTPSWLPLNVLFMMVPVAS